jgi:ESS family glutamate:Na+ symporter
VVGGVLFALLLAVLDGVTGLRFTMDESLKAPLLLAFFATLGLGADVRSLSRGGWKLVILLALFVIVMVMQCAIGVGMALLLDLHPLVGLLGGSISLVGGHGTAAAYAASFAETRNLQGALELGMAAATAGLILGSLLAGPVAERAMRRSGSKSAATAATRGPREPQGAVYMPITAEQLLFVLLVCLVCIGGALLMGNLMKGTGILLPDFLWALLIGMGVRNVLAPLAARAGLDAKPINDRAVQALGSVTLSLFLIMALMSMRILDLATLAGPLLLVVAVNAMATAAFAYLVTARVMGGDHDAAVISGGQVAAGLATTAVAMSVIQTLSERHGPAPLAFLLIPIVGAFFADIANALVLQAFFALPALGF